MVINITINTKSFALNCKRAVQNKFVAVWNDYLQDYDTNQHLRTKVFKGDFKPYLCFKMQPAYHWNWKGRHTKPETPVAKLHNV